MNTRGISPLISGILLLAFSLFMGITILSWASQAKNRSGESLDLCAAVHIGLVTIDDQALTCTMPERLRLAIENLGAAPLTGILVQKRSAQEIVNIQHKFPLEPGYAKLEEIPLEGASRAQSIKVVPISKDAACAASGIVLDPPQECP